MNFTEFVRNYHIQLNEQQMQAVQATEGPVLLLAVPGSGKTTVLVSRLGYMIYCLGITPESILTVTYTVAATNDMRRRFAGMFGEADAERLEFRTINGISQKVLQYFAYRTGKTPFQVADKEASAAVKQSFLEVTGKYATENDIKETQLDITYAKNMRLTPEKIFQTDGVRPINLWLGVIHRDISSFLCRVWGRFWSICSSVRSLNRAAVSTHDLTFQRRCKSSLTVLNSP